MMHDHNYTNLVIPKSTENMVSQEVQFSNSKEKARIKYLQWRLEEEKDKRLNSEKERNILINSLDDMTAQAKRLEQTLRDFERENIDLYEKLKRWNLDLVTYADKSKEAICKLTEMQLEKDKCDNIIEDQKNQIEDHLKTLHLK